MSSRPPLPPFSAESAAAKASARGAYEERAAALLQERDASIAHRIDETLPPSGVGLLFIGQAHQITRHLAPDIVTRNLLSR